MTVLLSLGVLALGACTGAPPREAPITPHAPAYRIYVANESSDVVSRVAFHPDSGLWVEKEIPVGLMPTDNDGAHGVAVSQDGDHWYLSIAHGTPFGTVWKFRTGVDTLEGRAELGLFPATMSLSPDGNFLFAANFNLHGDRVPSSVSVVHTPSMTELTKVTTCVMPHGSRVSEDGRHQYSACMHSDQLVAIDLSSFEVTLRLSVTPGSEGPLTPGADERTAEGRGAGAPTSVGHPMDGNRCGPTWAQPGRGQRAHLVYVPCNRNSEVLEIDPRSGTVVRRFSTGAGPYNVDISPDGSRLVVSLKGAQSVSVIDLDAGSELARLRSSRPVTHGVAIGPRGRYAFVSNESVGSDRGTLDVVDLERLEVIHTAELAHQPGGLGIWVPAG